MKSVDLKKNQIVGFILMIVIALLFSVIIFSFTSCESEETKIDYNLQTIEVPTEVTQINWIGHWLNEGNKGDLVRDVAREFEFMNQEYRVNLKFPEEVYYNKASDEIDFVVQQLQSTNPEWDIIRLYGNYDEIGRRLDNQNWMEDYLVDFKNVAGFMDRHKSFINNGLYKMRNNGSYFGPHSEGQIAALYVNLDVAQKIGISVKQFGMTFDDFKGYLKAAFEYNQSHEQIIPVFEYNWGKTNTIFNILFYSLMNDMDVVLTKQLTQVKLNAIQETLMALEELSKYNPINRDWLSRDWNKDKDLIFKDKCLFFPNLTFMYSIWVKDYNDKLNTVIPCEYPVFKPSNIYIGGYLSNWAVLKRAPHKDAAIKLLMHWTRPDISERWVRMSKSSTGVKGNITNSSFGIDPHEDYTNTIDEKYRNLIRDEDRVFIVGEENINLNIRVQDVLLGNITALEAMNEFVSQAVVH